MFEVSVLYQDPMEYQEVERFHWFWMCVRKKMDQIMKHSMIAFFTDGSVSWVVCTCRFQSSKLVYFSEVDEILPMNW